MTNIELAELLHSRSHHVLDVVFVADVAWYADRSSSCHRSDFGSACDWNTRVAVVGFGHPVRLTFALDFEFDLLQVRELCRNVVDLQRISAPGTSLNELYGAQPTTTSMPSSASCSAMPLPMPLDAPVTIATTILRNSPGEDGFLGKIGCKRFLHGPCSRMNIDLADCLISSSY